jgi:formyl-CoA transferase
MVTHPEAGVHPEIGVFARFSKTPIEIRMPAPCLGEHNRYVFGQLLGMSSEAMSYLEKQGIIGTTPSEIQQGSMY